MQLWTGTKEWDLVNNVYQGISATNTKFYDNSVSAYNADYDASNAQFLVPYMGLTASSTVSAIDGNGFVDYGQYISNQGSLKHLANAEEVVQVAPAPYGAALALPFAKPKALEAIRAFIDLGFYHEYMGLPDNVVFEEIGVLKPLPNWNQLDINMAPIAMAIDQMSTNPIISTTLMNRPSFREAYRVIYESFNADYITQSNTGSTRLAEEAEEWVEQNEDLTKGIVVYPNPTSGDFMIQLSVEEPGAYQGYFVNASGQLIHQVRWELGVAGRHDLPVDGLQEKGIGAGLYFMAVIGPEGKSIVPVIIKD